ncbi:MFS transporter [Nonomuraea sp. NPDC049758]|uniref:MFS transporter n=1 Tax=Nonomuraea sp. NPDC049758 TaxID=3154360 RepID=UPI003429CE14
MLTAARVTGPRGDATAFQRHGRAADPNTRGSANPRPTPKLRPGGGHGARPEQAARREHRVRPEQRARPEQRGRSSTRPARTPRPPEHPGRAERAGRVGGSGGRGGAVGLLGGGVGAGAGQEGALTVTGGSTLLVFALVEGPALGWGSPLVAGAFAVAAVLLVIFALVEARSADPLMPFRLFRNRSLTVGMLVTFVYMATFGVLPYFLTVLLQSVHGYSALQSGLAFLVPSLAIAAGTQGGERLATRIGTRTTLLIGFAVGVAGTAVLALGFDADAGYGLLIPGLVVSGLGQGVVWTAMWIAAATGTPAHEQGVANGIASTALNIGNAIGLAVFTVIADLGAAGRTGRALRAATADGEFLVVLLTAAVMIAGLLVTLTRPRRTP